MVTEKASERPARHQLPMEWFATLSAGKGSAAITRFLWQTERSRRLLLINAVLDEASQQPDLLRPLPSANSAWDTLAAAQAAAPADVDAILLHPQVGSWAAYTLRRQLGQASSSLPLWADFGGVHTLSLVAAARAGLSWHTQVPIRAGQVILPTLGMARFPEAPPAAVAEAETDGGRIRLRSGDHQVIVPADPTADASGWWGLRGVQVGDDLVLSVWLDDLDPFRDLADPVPAARLDGAEFERWERLLREAWDLLCRDHRVDAEAMADGVVSLVPLPFDDGWETRSASTGEAFGSIMMSPPPDAVAMAVALVHEFQHIKLGALLHLVQLTAEDNGTLHYAPWRDDPRPLGGLLQGVYAFLGIASFWRRRHESVSGADAALAAFEYGHARGQTDEALRLVRSTRALTTDGFKFVDGLIARMTPWLSGPLTPEIDRLVQLTLDSHRTAWRLRHLRPEPGEVLGLAKAWLAGNPPDVHLTQPTIVPHPDLRWPQRIPILARRRAVAVGRRNRNDAASVTDESPTTLAVADAALVAGKARAARDGYLAVILDSSRDLDGRDQVDAWTGLALAVAHEGPRPAASALLTRPELVRAVHVEIAATGAAPDPVDLAGWLAGASPSA